jgi:hypothetical protein
MHSVTKRRTSRRITQSQSKQPILKRKRTKKMVALFAGAMSIGQVHAPNHKFKQEKKSANMIVSKAGGGISRYGNSLSTILSVCNSPEWWMDTGANINVCADASLFSSYQVSGTGALLMGNGSHARVLGVGTVILKFTSGKMVLLKNVQHVPSKKRNLVSSSQMVIKLLLKQINVYC